jgi:predicted Zn-dependent protease
MKPLCRIFIVATLMMAGCYTNPVTGRQSLVLVQPNEELALGAQSFKEIEQKEKISSNRTANDRVRRVGERIAKAVGDQMPNAEWEFVVFESDQVNAFALPGGKVGVYTGLLKLATSDDELAVVMGHEIGHVIARHGAERITQQMMVQGVATIGSAYADGRYNPQVIQIAQAAYGAGAALTTLSFSRANESEADHMGVVFAAEAGYDPRAAIGFWEKMSAQKTAKPGLFEKFLSTHPTDDKRIADLKALMPQVVPLYEANRGKFK